MEVPTTQNEEEKRRLIFAKMLFNHGFEHSVNGTGIDRMIAVHNFHNAIEMILKSVAVKYDIRPKKDIDFKFKDLWNEINKNENYRKENEELPLKNQIFGLHDLRNRIQHHGDEPSRHDTQKYYHFAEDFIRQVFEDAFSESYDNLFMSSLIENERIKKLMLEGEKQLNEGNYKVSIEKCATAFCYAWVGTHHGCLLEPGEEPSSPIMANWIRNIGLVNISLLEFSRFKRIAPNFLFGIFPKDEAKWKFTLQYEDNKKEEVYLGEKSKENALFILNFVLNKIRKWQRYIKIRPQPFL